MSEDNKEMYCPACGGVVSIEGTASDRWRTIFHHGHFIQVKRSEGSKVFIVLDTRAAVLSA